MGEYRFTRNLCFAAASALALAAGLGDASAQAQAQPISESSNIRFDIPAQPLSSAILEYSRQARVVVMAPTELVSGRRSSAVVGEMAAGAALNQLLRGSGLEAQHRGSGALTLVQTGETASPTQLGAAEAPSAADEEIIVSGTRIRGPQVSASPSHSLDREDFADAGATTIEQVMRNVPQNFTGGYSEVGGALSSSRNGATANGGYGSGINLRGLGNASTLILLNGQRIAPVGLGGFVDTAAIPLSALERIDVVTDGASAIYGSDAVGGVVNFVLRDNYQGAETSVRYGTTTDGGLRDFAANQLIGTAWSSGSALINFDYGQREPLLASERPYSSALAATGTTFLTPSDERLGVLINLHQDLTDALSLSATAYGNTRDAEVDTYVAFQARQFDTIGSTEQTGGTLTLDWRVSDEWLVTLAHTAGRNHNEREGALAATTTLPAIRSLVTSDMIVSSTELEAEGVLFQAPGGAARLAIGAEHRNEDMRETRSAGPSSAASGLRLDRSIDAAYAELFVPLASNAPWAHRLDISGAIRYEDYSDVGESDIWKVGAVWAPFEGLNFRATAGTSFRAPYLYQFSTALGFAYLALLPNPDAADGDTLIAIISQIPATDLGPETATTWTAGFDIDPAILSGFRFSATYFDIDYEDRIAAARLSITPFTDPDLAGLVSMPADPDIIHQIETDIDPSQIYLLFGATGPVSGAEATYDGRTRNQARTEVSGLDVNLSRIFSTDVGDFDVGINASYLFTFDNQQSQGSPAIDIVDTVFNPVDLRGTAYLRYNNGGWHASANVNYVDDYTDNQVPPFVSVSSWTTVDLSLAYNFNAETGPLSGLTVRANAVNAFDEAPPSIIDRQPAWGNPGFDTENANPLGRIVSLQLVKSW